MYADGRVLPKSGDCVIEQRNVRYIGLNVYHIRKNVLQVSQEEFAYMVGMSKDTVSNIERGVYLPNLQNLVNICNCVHLPMDFFLRENTEEIPIYRVYRAD